MRKLPILFKGPMVCAVLEDRKTQTRRVVKAGGEITWASAVDGPRWAFRVDGSMEYITCPYGQPGDALYVRETWRWDHSENDVTYRADDSTRRFLSVEADEWSRLDWQRPHRHAQWNSRWRPSIHMPKWAARIWLRVTGVRVERVQDIVSSAHDIMAEGIIFDAEAPIVGPCEADAGDLVEQFSDLWDRLNAKRGFGWDVNPWVWVVEFEQTERSA